MLPCHAFDFHAKRECRRYYYVHITLMMAITPYAIRLYASSAATDDVTPLLIAVYYAMPMAFTTLLFLCHDTPCHYCAAATPLRMPLRYFRLHAAAPPDAIDAAADIAIDASLITPYAAIIRHFAMLLTLVERAAFAFRCRLITLRHDTPLPCRFKIRLILIRLIVLMLITPPPLRYFAD